MPPRESELQTRARQFVEDEVMPNASAWEREGAPPKSLHERVADRGLTLLLLGPEDGGPGAGVLDVARVAEEFGAGGLSFALPLLAHNYVAWSIADFGSNELKQDYLPAMLGGKRVGIFSLTEPQSGSDATRLQTLAEKTVDGWRLTGEKAWVTRARDADFFAVYAQTKPGSGAKGIAQFLIPGDTPGLVRESDYEMLGGNPVGMGSLRLEGAVIPPSHMLAPPGEGLRYALKAIDWARAYVAAICVGMLRRSLEEAIAYTLERRMFGQTTAEFQAVQFVFAEAETDLVASREVTDAALRALDAGEPDGTVLAAHAKKFATRAALDRIGQCMQMMGANGMKHDFSLSRHFIAAKMTQYLDGATEVQNVVIARSLMRRQGTHS